MCCSVLLQLPTEAAGWSPGVLVTFPVLFLVCCCSFGLHFPDHFPAPFVLRYLLVLGAAQVQVLLPAHWVHACGLPLPTTTTTYLPPTYHYSTYPTTAWVPPFGCTCLLHSHAFACTTCPTHPTRCCLAGYLPTIPHYCPRALQSFYSGLLHLVFLLTVVTVTS